jgi:drug/metabolite transporter (DMT)-like permease
VTALHYWKADLSILGVTVVWGSSFVFMKNVMEFTPVFAYLSLRFILASVLMCIIFFQCLKKLKASTVIWGFLVGLAVFVGSALQVTGLKYTTASNSGFITGLSVTMVPVLSAVLLKKKPPVNAVAGVVLAAIGLFFLTGGIQFKFNKGDFLTLLCAVSFAFHIIVIDKAVSREDPVQIAILQIISAAVMFTMVWGFQAFTLPVINTTLVTTILWTGVLGTTLGFSVLTVAQKYTTPTRAALIITCEPVFAAIFAWTIPNSQGITETPGPFTIIGCILVFSGMILSKLPTFYNKRKSALADQAVGETRDW